MVSIVSQIVVVLVIRVLSDGLVNLLHVSRQALNTHAYTHALLWDKSFLRSVNQIFLNDGSSTAPHSKFEETRMTP